MRKKDEYLLDAVVQDRDTATISTTGSISATSVMSSSSPSAIVSSSPISTSPPLSSTSAFNAQTSTSSKNNTGAIVGGVIGGIALLVLIIGMILVFRRQYLHAGSKPKRTQSSSAGSVAHEISGTDSSQELDARQVHELHDTRGSLREMQ
ncbi:hypothetical protein MMC29_003536 [Sticta canariensis]|nr:hypothetical protein [Sticta canariensis]